jgi:hypothetical protein
MMISRLLALALVALSISAVIATVPPVLGYVPNQGDYFSYNEVVDLGSGQGNYTGYAEHTVTTGTETMNMVFSNGTVAAHYGFTWTFSNSSGSMTNGGSAGNFTYSSSSFYYVKGTDNLTGYVNPTVWFYMANSVAKGGTFYLLNTQMTVLDQNYSYSLASQNRYVQAIHAQGSSSYLRNDVYGRFNAAYTWDTYFDPTTGYIIGYGYVEHDTDSSGNGFTWNENLYVTSTSYSLATASPPANSGLSQLFYLIVGLAVIVTIIIVIVVVALALRRRRGGRLQQHPVQDYSRMPSEMGTPPPTIDLTPRQPPAQQIVIKEVAKVRCKYCGALVDSTAVVCPVCGGPTT